MSEPVSGKQRVALHAANLIEDGMIVGLGTGSTANYFIEALSQRKQQGLKITTVASSIVSTIKAQQLDLEPISIDQLTHVDVYVDGADEVTAEMILLKGRGADLVREKLLANASEQFYVLVDESKMVKRIGQNYPIPVEVMTYSFNHFALIYQHIKLFTCIS
jgi:ribose 5-phosphate isomerase A